MFCVCLWQRARPHRCLTSPLLYSSEISPAGLLSFTLEVPAQSSIRGRPESRAALPPEAASSTAHVVLFQDDFFFFKESQPPDSW